MTGFAGSTGDGASAAWVHDLAELLPGDDAAARAAAFAARVPASYRELTPPEEAAEDLAELDRLAADAGDETAGRRDGPFGGHHRLVVRPSTDPECTFRIRRYGEGGIELTSFLPVLESFGLVVVEAVPHRIGPGPAGERGVHVDDIGVRTDAPHGPEALRFVPEIHGPRLVAALEALAAGEADVDSLNRLVTVAGFDWRQTALVRTYLRYRLQTDSGLSYGALADPLAAFPDVARALLGHFQARFDPDLVAARAADSERARCLAELDLVPRLDQDQVLRAYLQLIDATVRTNYYQRGPDGALRPTITVKLDSSAVPDLPKPRPKFEAFVHGPRVEGIHLRAGLIARGGLRWSERPSDFRTEVLDLAFAQVKKNAIIVPTGAKGGFVYRGAGSQPVPERVQGAYELFVSSLLDVTDNVVAGEVVRPERVVAVDAADPYLVVAADKGTATFSDLANSISEERRFWLGDAFASGGSHGYDHKAMAITARGAWVAVRRHFRQLGIDVQSDPITVAGVGDMSGDVFGNGMLRSETIRLVAAFDHRHVFLDPDPDPAVSFAERRRLAGLPRSSWADYNPELISPGGGVWPRDVKTVPLSPAVRRALGVDAEAVSAPALVSAIVAAPVDLLWFGGIGTFVKAPGESDSDVGDHTNDPVRINADQVRARVIAEGANLGITQRARIRYSRRGGRINADFIDNAAGVATSDREVNLKILLALAIEEGRLAPADRDGYLARSEDEVAAEVLRQVDHSVAVLNRTAAHSAQELDAYEALIDHLEDAGAFDRAVECLPDTEEIRVRRGAGAGLIRPELAVLLAYAKSDLVAAIEHTPEGDDPAFLDAVVPYFPVPIRDAFGDLIPRHRLYCQLVATDVAGEIVDQLGIVWGHETAAELGRRLAEVAHAFWAARQVVRAGSLWGEVERLSDGLTADAEAALHDMVSEAVMELARCYLNRAGAVRPGALIERDSPLADQLEAAAGSEVSKAAEDALVEVGVARNVASRFVAARIRAGVGDAGPVASGSGRPVAEAAAALGLIDRAAGLDRLVPAVEQVLRATSPPGRLTVWQGRALLDDIAAWRRAVAIDVLHRPGTPVAAAADWESERQDELDRALTLLSTLDGGSADPLTVVSLVLRRLRAAA